MKKRLGLLSFATALAIGTAAPVLAQHQGHQMPGPAAQAAGPQAGAVPGCAQSAQAAARIVARERAAGRTATMATRTELRRAVEQMTAAARAAQAELAGCAGGTGATVPAQDGRPQPDAPAMDHSRMKMPGMRASRPPAGAAPMDHSKMKMPGSGASRPPAAAVPMDHSKMNMPPAAAGSSATPGAVDHSKMNMPPAAAGSSATPGAVDHSKMNMGGASAGIGKADPKMPVVPAERVMDPACPTFNAPTAPKAVFSRKVYYFCSDKDREEFRRDPAAYLTKRPRG
ncbi:MAG TPA: hypothetical protein VNJ04_07180 [Gemmatimonadaceae bacterium]|nr:hypothetical protein [Gemmatimonadaceae bacterium]